MRSSKEKATGSTLLVSHKKVKSSKPFLGFVKNKGFARFLFFAILVQALYSLFMILFKGVFPVSLLGCLVITFITFGVLPKNALAEDKLKNKKTKAYSFVLVLLGLFVALVYSEALNYRSVLLTQSHYFSLHYIKSFALALLLLFGFAALIYALCGKVAVGVGLSATTLLVMSLVNYYILLFRDRAFLPQDFYATQTSMNVIGEYYLPIGPAVVASVIVLIILWIWIIKITPLLWPPVKNKLRLWISRGISLIVAATLVFGCFSTHVWAKVDLVPQPWNPNETSASNTFILNFLATIPYSKVNQPAAYSPQKNYLQTAYPSQQVSEAQKDRLPDKVIFIMSEAFSDFTAIDGLELNQDPLSFWHQLQNEKGVIHGKLVVNTFGGGTSLSEFEALTGTLGVLTNGVNESVMQRIVHSPVQGLPTTAKALGYTTIGAHPAAGSNWGRNDAYPHMGFDEFLSLEDMDFLPEAYLRAYVSDDAFFRYITDLIDPIQEPVFLFGITMQNHGGYTAPDEDFFSPDGYTKDKIEVLSPQGEYLQVGQYLSLLKASDNALQWLVNHYRQREEKVAIVMFGDHWPYIGDEFEEMIKQLVSKEEYPLTSHTVPYMVWSNYDLPTPSAPTEQIGVNYLAVLMKEVFGMPLTGFDKYLQELWQTYPVVSSQGIIDTKGNRIDISQAKRIPILNYYSVFQFNNLTGKGGYMKNLSLEE